MLHFFKDIKIAHSVFALPFAMVGFLIGDLPVPRLEQIGLALVCMVAARTFAMGVNRFLDRDVDRANPRTAGRAIPAGKLTPKSCAIYSGIAAIIFVIASFSLSQLAGILSLPVLLILGFYSAMKRLSWLTHWYLGACLGLAPIAVNIAFAGQVPLAVFLIGVAVMVWTAGFDILYSLQDEDFDRKNNLRSVPARFGASQSVRIAAVSFALMIACLIFAGLLTKMHWIYYAGVTFVSAVLVFELRIISRWRRENQKESLLNSAFFTANAWVSVLFYAVVQIEKLVY